LAFDRLERLSSDGDLLNSLVKYINDKIRIVKEPLLNQLKSLKKQITQNGTNQETHLKLFQRGQQTPDIVIKVLNDLETEMKSLLERKRDLEEKLLLPTINEVSIDEVYKVISSFP